MLRELLEECFDPESEGGYLRLEPDASWSYWPPFIELLLRAGVAEKHPSDETLLRLVQFHC